MKALKVALALILATGLVVGVALPGLAASEETAPEVECKPGPRMLKGEVVSVNATEEFFTIQAGERSVEIKVNKATRYFKLAIPRKLIALRQQRTEMRQAEGYQGVELMAKPRTHRI